MTRTRARVAEEKKVCGFEQMRELAKASQHRPLSLLSALQRSDPAAVIAEIKFASPSRGTIYAVDKKLAERKAQQIAISYQNAGAAAISVLTEPDFFQGCLNYLRAVRRSVNIPLLRKDFIVDSYQIYQSLASGADIILLIVAGLERNQLQDLYSEAIDNGLSVIVEVHNEKEWQLAERLQTPIIGVNNRNLKTFAIDTNTTLQLARQNKNSHIICESGIDMQSDLKPFLSANVSSFLIGECFMRHTDPGLALQQFMQNI